MSISTRFLTPFCGDQTLLSSKPAENNQNRLLWNVIGDRRTINAGTTAPAGVLLAPHVF